MLCVWEGYCIWQKALAAYCQVYDQVDRALTAKKLGSAPALQHILPMGLFCFLPNSKSGHKHSDIQCCTMQDGHEDGKITERSGNTTVGEE